MVISRHAKFSLISIYYAGDMHTNCLMKYFKSKMAKTLTIIISEIPWPYVNLHIVIMKLVHFGEIRYKSCVYKILDKIFYVTTPIVRSKMVRNWKNDSILEFQQFVSKLFSFKTYCFHPEDLSVTKVLTYYHMDIRYLRKDDRTILERTIGVVT
jgi:hypothetical protein